MKGSQIKGEYKRVSCLTEFPYIMTMANESLLTPVQACEMIDSLIEQWPVCLEKGGVFSGQLVFVSENARGKARYNKIWLPSEGMKLRVGLILHEFSHVLHQSQGIEGSAHGPEFTRILDTLLKNWYLSL